MNKIFMFIVALCIIAMTIFIILASAPTAVDEPKVETVVVKKEPTPVNARFVIIENNAVEGYYIDLYEDTKTGCQYLIRDHFMEPILQVDGKPYCPSSTKGD
jgi:hypothetical protein